MVANPFSEGLLVKINADASGLQNELGSAIAVLSNFDKAVMGVGAGLMALAGGGLVASVNAAADFEEAMVGVAKVTDPAFAREFGTAIREMAREIPIAHQELARIAEVGAQLGVPQKQLEGFTRTVAMMASTTDLSADEAANAFARIGTLMDIPYDKADELGSAMNELSNNMGASAGEISNVMVRAGASFHALGLGADEALGLAAAMNEVSPSSRLAAGGLKRMSDALLEPGKVNKIARALGMTSAEFKNLIDNNPQQALMMVAQFMAEGGPAADKLREDIGNVAGEFAILGSNLEGVENGTAIANEQMREGTSLAQEFETATSTFNAKLQILKNQLVDIGIGIGTVFLPALTLLVEALSVAVGWFSKINDATGGLAGAVLLLGTLFAGAVIFIGGAISALGGMAAAMAPVIAGIQALVTVIGVLLNPLGMLVAAKATLITVGTALAGVLGAIGWPILLLIGLVALLAAMWSSNFGGIRDQTARVMSVLRDEFGPIIEKLGAIFGTVLPQISSAVSAMVSAVEPYFAILFAWIADALIWAIIGLADITLAAVNGMIAAWQLVEPVVSGVIQGLLVLADIFAVVFIDLFKLLSAVIRGDWEEAWLWVYNIFADIAGRIIGFLSQWFPQIDAMMAGRLGEWRDQWMLLGQDLWATVSGTFEAIRSIITLALNYLQTTVIQPFLDWFRTAWTENITPVLEEARATWDVWKQALTEAIAVAESVIAAFVAWFLPIWRENVGAVVTEAKATWDVWRATIASAIETVQTAIAAFVAWFLPLWQENMGPVVAEAAATWALWQEKIEGAVAYVQEIITAFTNWFAPLWQEKAGQTVTEATDTWTVWQTRIETVIALVSDRITAFTTWLAPYWNTFWVGMMSVLNTVVEGVRVFMGLVVMAFTLGFNNLIGFVNMSLGILKGAWNLFNQDLISIVTFFWELMKGIFVGAFTTITTLAVAFFQLLQGDWRAAFTTIWTLTQDILNGIVAFITGWGGRLVARIGEIVRGVINWFLDLGRRLIWGSLIPDIFNAITTFVVGWISRWIALWVSLVTRTVTYAVNLGQRLIAAFRLAFRTILTAVTTFSAGVISRWTNLRNRVISATQSLRTRAVAEVNRLASQAIARFNNLRSRAVSLVRSAANQIVTRFTTLKNRAIAQARALANGFISRMNNLKSSAARAAREIANRVVSALKGAVSNAKTAGKNLIGGFIDGIKSKSRAAANAVGGVLSGVRSRFTSSDAEEGPLDDISTTGPALLETFAHGLINSEGIATEATRSVMDSVRSELTARFAQTGVMAALAFAQGLRDSISPVVAAARELREAVLTELGLFAEEGQFVEWAAQYFNRGQFAEGVGATIQQTIGQAGITAEPQTMTTARIGQNIDDLARSNRRAIRNLEQEMALRLDALLSEVRNSEGEVRMDGKLVGEVTSRRLESKKYDRYIIG